MDFGPAGSGESELLEYPNIPGSIGRALSSRLVTLTELGSTLGLEDLWDILEVIAVNAHNDIVMAKRTRVD